jgi:D-glycerate 3-kinase
MDSLWKHSNWAARAEVDQLTEAVYPALNEFCRMSLGWAECPPDRLRQFWVPLALQLESWYRPLGRPLIQGILGGQGTGKTTLASILSQILGHLGLQVCQLSLDDLYQTYAERQHLQQVDPRWRWRGPPGTHDVALGVTVLEQLRQRHYPVSLPQFDKSAWGGAGDRTTPILIARADIVLFEGWCVGVRPIDPACFDTAPPPISTEADRAFAREVNAKLNDYLALWNLLDRLIVLYPTDYRLSQQWRRQAERQMIATGRSGMTDGEVDQFVDSRLIH